jgi:PST family polysaccharide transporter
MKPIFRATALLGGSSVISILFGLVSAKVMALLLQPAGYGYYGLLQSFVGVTSLIGGMGLSTGLVRLGAGPIAAGDERAVASLRRGAWLILWVLCGLLLAVLGMFRRSLSLWMLGSAAHSSAVPLLGLAVLLTVAGNVQTGTLNAYHRVGALASYGVVNSIFGTATAIVAILICRSHGTLAAVVGGAIVAWAVSAHLLKRHVCPTRLRPSRGETLRAASSLLSFGVPFTASAMLGTGVQLALPVLVLHLLSTESVGYYKAATAISIGYLGFLVTAMGQDYYPRLAAVKDEPAALVDLINEQHRLVMLLAVPLILGTLAFVPYLVPLVYSSRFSPTVELLEWQLIGDLFKFSSWTMSFAILARCKAYVYLLTESIGGAATILLNLLAVRWFGLPGLGIGFLMTYVIYYLVVWIIVRRDLHLVWTTSNRRMMLTGVAFATIIRALPATQFASLRNAVALVLAIGVGLFSVHVLWKEYMGRMSSLRKAQESES